MRIRVIREVSNDAKPLPSCVERNQDELELVHSPLELPTQEEVFRLVKGLFEAIQARRPDPDPAVGTR